MLNSLNIETITLANIESLINNGIPEGLRIEYKSQLYTNSDASKKEFLKDISSFANTSGGYLFIGIEESSGSPTSLCPLQFDPDSEILRLQNLIQSGIEPRIYGVRIKSIEHETGSVVVVHIPLSTDRPHRVHAYGTNRFHGRNSAGVYELSTNELRHLFNSGRDMISRVRDFRQDRLSKIVGREIPMSLEDSRGKLVVHIVGSSFDGESTLVDLQKAHADYTKFVPLAVNSISSRYNFDGLLVYDGDSPCHSYTQVFRTGAIETLKGDIWIERDDKRLLFASDIEENIIGLVPRYIARFSELDVVPPYFVMISLLGVGNSKIPIPSEYTTMRKSALIHADTLILPEIKLDRVLEREEFATALRPVFDVMWNASGISKSVNYDDQGNWIRPR